MQLFQSINRKVYVIALHPDGREMEIAESSSLSIFSYMFLIKEHVYNFGKNNHSFDGKSGGTEKWQFCRAILCQIGKSEQVG